MTGNTINTYLTVKSVSRSKWFALVVLGTNLLVSCGVREDDASQFSSSATQVGATLSPGSSTQAISPLSCGTDDMKSWVRANMLDYYLFSDRVDTNLDINAIDSPEQVVTALRVSPEDRFSYMADESQYNAFFNEGQVFGYGWNFARAENNTWFFSLIEAGSPLDLAGVERGDQLVSLNGTPLSATFAPDTVSFSVAAYPSDITSTIDLGIRNSTGFEQTVSVVRSEYTLQTVLQSSVFQSNGVNVGYLAFYQFLQTSTAELDAAFAQFDNANISEMVLDLRFNGGGRVDVANDLASYLIGGDSQSAVFARFTYNDRYEGNNFAVNYKTKTSAPQLNRVFVLQSANTCSASELVVNSLRSHMEVITVGSTSCGKPYATSPNTACSKVLNALEIDIQNADGAGGYFEGIAADCPASENVSIALGDTAEPLLGEAIEYINTGSCGTSSFDEDQLFDDINETAQALSKAEKPLWHGGNQL